MSDTLLAWLAGIVDGEGSIGIYQYKTEEVKPSISIGNTSVELLVAVVNILESLNLSYTVYHKTQQNRNWKHAGVVQMQSHRDILTILNLILPYLVAKKSHAIVLKRFVESRLPKLATGGRAIGQNRRVPLDETEQLLKLELSILNKKGAK